MFPALQLGLSTCDKTIDETLFRAYRDANIDFMELAVTGDVYEGLNLAEIHAWAELYGVQIRSFHLPFAPFDQIDLSNSALADATVARYCRYIDEVSSIGVRIFTVHPSGEPISNETRAERILCAKKSLARLADYAATRSCIIAVEDLPRSCLGNCIADMIELTSAHEDLRVCFDTNHLLAEDAVAFIHALGHKMVNIHVSDFDRINECHWLPGEGCIDWQALISALHDVGYQGPWLYEIAFYTPQSITRARALTCQDFRDNYDALMHGERPPFMGTPRKRTGLWSFSD